MKVRFSSIIIGVLLMVNMLLTGLSGQYQLIPVGLSIAIGCYIFVNSTKKLRSSGDIFQPLMICNVFLMLFFVLRPIWLLVNIDELHSYSNFRYYEMTAGAKEYFAYPVAKAEFIGILGMYFINVGYFSNFRLQKLPPFKSTEAVPVRRGGSRATKLTCWFLFGAAAFFWLLYIYRGFIQGGTISMIYVIWVYILTVSIPIYIAHKGRINFAVMAILAISIVSLVALGNRQLIISLLLCVVVTQIQLNTNVKKHFMKTLLLLCLIGVGMAAVVVWFASVRYNYDLTLNRGIEAIFGEFGMYDMLVVSLDAELKGMVPRYYGFYYLTFFSFFIPTINIPPFDHQLVQDVFGGLLGGGIPVSVVGSLYINFGYVGLIVLSFVLGRIFSSVYCNNRSKGTLLGDIQNIVLLTFVYDLTRVGDFGREAINYGIMYLCLRIAFIFITREQDQWMFSRIHGGHGPDGQNL